MASSGPQQTTPPSSRPEQQAKDPLANPYIHNIALIVTPVGLLGLFLPPRRVDMRAALLGGTVLWGTNQLVYDYSGTSSLRRIQQRVASLSGTDLPEKARETQARLRAERERKRLQEISAATAGGGGEGGGLSEGQRKLVEEQQQQQRRGVGGKEEERGLLKKVWMGDAEDDWKEKRSQREKEALSEGGSGYWGLIMDQLSEVWGGKKKDDVEKGKENTEDGQNKS